VSTALDGVPWTSTDVGRDFLNLGWGENALAKQHGSMQGPWDAEYTQLNWATTPAAPVISISRLPSGNMQLSWPFGTLLESNDVSGPWTPIPGAASPYEVPPVADKAFYGLQ